MLFLHFRIGGDSFALGTDGIVEVVPLSDLKQMRQAPDGVAGSLEYRGRFVPVIDLSVLETGTLARRRLSTRIIVMRHPADENLLIGLMAENATETLRLDPIQFTPFATGPHGLVQRIEVQDLVPPPLLTFLAGQSVASA
jgi:chemotaxis-related protein WspB